MFHVTVVCFELVVDRPTAMQLVSDAVGVAPVLIGNRVSLAYHVILKHPIYVTDKQDHSIMEIYILVKT